MINSIPMTTARALGGMPDFIREEVGSKGLAHVMRKSDMPYVALEKREFFIPQSKIVVFLGASAYLTGEQNLGLNLARHLTLRDYGVWGDYVLAAPTLGASQLRGQKALKFHSSNDFLRTTIDDRTGIVRFVYGFTSSHINGYNHIASCAAGILMNQISHYVGCSWAPEWVELNIPKPRGWSVYEETFGCPVVFNAPSVAVAFRHECLDSPAPETQASYVPSLSDVSRVRRGDCPTSLDDIVSEQIRVQLAEGAVKIDGVASGLGMGVRKLQRELEGFGTTFREMTNKVLLQRAKQLLCEMDISITSISAELGYSAPAHFARAFRKETGVTPLQFRKTLRH